MPFVTGDATSLAQTRYVNEEIEAITAYAFMEMLEGGFTACLVEFLKSIETVTALPHQLTGFGDIVELLRQFQHAGFHLDDLLLRRHCPRSFREEGGL